MNEGTPIVTIIDDDASVLRSLGRLVRSIGLEVETFISAHDFLECTRSTESACLILDVRMPGLSGLDLQEELSARNLGIPIIFITGHGTIPMSVHAMKAGAVDFLQKPFNDQELLDCIQKAIKQNDLARRQRAEADDIRRRVEELTPREREVFALVTTGMLNKQIAGELGVGEKTIKVHRARVMQKMQADSLAHLVRLADKVGIKPPEKTGTI
ncbi:MAG: response regulator transcription factor [Proteobacteria bacterium]|nr:response regulator transcription factor [Pseudomonadota bacterium]